MATEERVHELIAAGNVDGAATEALEALGPEILRYLRSLLRDEDDAADAFSQFAENLWRGLGSFRAESSLRTWAFRVAWHAALHLRNEAWRRRGRRFATGEASALAEEIRTRTAVRVARQKDQLDQLRQALTVDEQCLLALRLDQRFSWEEIADVLAEQGKPVKVDALMKRFERLKARLTELAREQGLVD